MSGAGATRVVQTVTSGRMDAVSVLTVYIVLLYGIPSGLRVVGLGSAGSPAMLLGILCLFWWGAEHVRAQRPVLKALGTMPALLLFFVLAMGGSYVTGMVRGQLALEGSTADTGLLRVMAWAGVFLVASDGITTNARLITLTRRLVTAGALIAVLGLLQFTFHSSLIGWFALPGLETDGPASLTGRSGFTRAMATAVHPLEFGVVATMCLPFAVVLALRDRGRPALARLWPLASLIGVLSISLSRSAIIGLAATVLVLAMGWGWRARGIAALAGSAVLVAVYLLVPGMASTVLSLFGGIGRDDSTVSRLEAQEVVFWVAGQNSPFGRGLGTFVPEYYIVDNQWLLSLVETGVVGLLALLSLLVGGIWHALSGRRRHTDPLLRDLGQACAAAVIGCALIMAFFDGLSFPMVGGTLFLVLGILSAYARLSLPAVALRIPSVNAPESHR